MIILKFILAFYSLSSAAVKPNLIPMESVILEKSMLLNGGSISSFGGGDTADARKYSAWFYGTNEISTCYNSIKSFNVSEQEIEAAVLKSISQWQTYFKEKEINKNLTKPINTNFKFIGKCKGGEALTLYFGTGPIFNNLRDLRARQSLHKPIAYVNKTHISEDLTWSQGYIRFIKQNKYSLSSNQSYPEWSQNSNLEIFILHELGHVLGFKHIEDTIMAEDLVNTKVINNNPIKALIDQKTELYKCSNCFKTYKLTKRSTDLVSSKSFIHLYDNTLSFVYSDGKPQKVTIINTLKKEQVFPYISMFQDPEAKFSESFLYFVKFTDRAQDRTFTLELKASYMILAEDGKELARFTYKPGKEL